MPSFCHTMSVLDLSDDELFPRRLDHFFGHHAYLINVKNAFNLGTQTMNETEISSGNPNDGRNGLHIAKSVLGALIRFPFADAEDTHLTARCGTPPQKQANSTGLEQEAALLV